MSQSTPQSTLPKFARRNVALPILAAIALIGVAFVATEIQREEAIQLAEEVREAQERMRVLAEVVYAAADAESSQRGYLLTRDPEYLEPYYDAKRRLDVVMPELRVAYQMHADEVVHMSNVEALIDKKFIELSASIELVQSTGAAHDAMQLVETGAGLRWMTEVRDEIEGMRHRERQHIYEKIQKWQRQHDVGRLMAGGAALLNVILLVVAGAFITRDIERRNATANELEQLVAQRTSDLSELSTHLQRSSEREKSQLARELHDELGGLLVAIKMDLSQLAKRFDVTQPDIQPRWQRIQSAISAGVDLKRRVIEELRPTLLDNMGLIAALRWQAEQSCAQAGITLQASFPEEEPALDANASIAIFRVAQEALTNIVKHARATAVKFTVQISDADLTLGIEDNGVGMPSTRTRGSDAHGILGMKHRVRAIGGTFYTSPVTPHGTRIAVRVPVHHTAIMATRG